MLPLSSYSPQSSGLCSCCAKPGSVGFTPSAYAMYRYSGTADQAWHRLPPRSKSQPPYSVSQKVVAPPQSMSPHTRATRLNAARAYLSPAPSSASNRNIE